MANPVARVQIVGLPQLVKKLAAMGDETLASNYRQALQGAADDVAGAAKGRAPYRTGRLRASIGTKLQASPRPRWAKIVVTAKAARGKKYAYPRLLEYSGKSKYRGWLKGALASAASKVQARLNGAARKIESAWNR